MEFLKSDDAIDRCHEKVSYERFVLLRSLSRLVSKYRLVNNGSTVN